MSLMSDLKKKIKAGGGINFTVEHTRAASDDKLYGLLESRLKRMLSAGICYLLK